MTNHFWWVEALIGFALFFALQYVVLKFLSRSKTQLFKPPLALLIWSLGILYFVDVTGKHLGFSIATTYLDVLRKTTLVAAFVWLFFRWKKEFEQTLLTSPKRHVDREIVQAVGRLATIGVMILTSLILLQIFGVNTAPLLAFGSIGAASLGFAGKDVMANFCSGIMLQMTRSLVLGDQIYLPEKKLQGHIEEIGWFRTLIRDTEKRAVYLPNNFFSTMLVVNISRMTHRHILQTVRLPFSAMEKIPEAISKIREVVAHFQGIDTKSPLHVFLKSFENYACEIEIEAYSTMTDAHLFNRLLQDLLFKVQRVLEEMNIPLAIPTIRHLT